MIRLFINIHAAKMKASLKVMKIKCDPETGNLVKKESSQNRNRYPDVNGQVQLCQWTGTTMSMDRYNYVNGQVQLCQWTGTTMSMDRYNYVNGQVQLCQWTGTMLATEMLA